MKLTISTEHVHAPTINERGLVSTPSKGFLYIKCPKCGEIRGFNAKTEIERYHCPACRTTSDLPPYFTLLFVNCECGKTFKYLTNITEKMFDIPCLNCGSPVATMLNEKTGTYETIRPVYRRKKR